MSSSFQKVRRTVSSLTNGPTKQRYERESGLFTQTRKDMLVGDITSKKYRQARVARQTFVYAKATVRPELNIIYNGI